MEVLESFRDMCGTLAETPAEALNRLWSSFVASLLCAFYLALDMCQAVCSSCVAACLSLPLAAGSLLFSGISSVARLEAKVRVPESALLELIEAASEVNDLDQGLELKKDNPSGAMQAECRGSRGGIVKLNIYDVSHESSIQNLNVFLAHPLSPFKFGGVFHAGVEIGGKEWSFGYAPSGSGVHCSTPRQHPQHNFRETLVLGSTAMTKEEVSALLDSMLDEYPGSNYHLIRCNCNHFASDLCRRLGVGELPPWVERLAWIGESLLEASEGFDRFRCVVEDAAAVGSHQR